MSFWDDLKSFALPVDRPYFSDVTWKQLEKESQAKSTAANEAILIEAKAKGVAESKGFTTDTNFFGTKTQAGSPQSGLPKNEALNFLDILKYNSTNAPSSFQESGKDKATVLTINSPGGESSTVATPSGSSVTQKAAKDTSQTAGFDWVTIILIVGAVFILVTLIKKG